MHRRSVLVLAATVSVAGCSALGGSDGVSASLDAYSEDPYDHFTEPFEASAGDELTISIDAGPDGADIVLVPEEDEADAGDMWGGAELHEEYWQLDADESIEDTVEVSEDDSYVLWIQSGTADVEVS